MFARSEALSEAHDDLSTTLEDQQAILQEPLYTNSASAQLSSNQYFDMPSDTWRSVLN